MQGEHSQRIPMFPATKSRSVRRFPGFFLACFVFVVGFQDPSHASPSVEVPLEWVRVNGAVSYWLRITKPNGQSVFQTHSIYNSVTLSLPPGDYLITIGVLNRFAKISTWSDPEKFHVGYDNPGPEIKKVTPDTLEQAQKEQRLIVEGKNLTAETRIQIWSNTGIIPIKSAQIDGERLVVILDTSRSRPGNYSVIVKNAVFAPSVLLNAVRLIDPVTSAEERKVAERMRVQEETAGKSYAYPGRFQPLWRSALLPGWGQFSQGRPITGTILGGTLIATGAGWYYYEQRYQKARNEYSQLSHQTLFLGAVLPYPYQLLTLTLPQTLATDARHRMIRSKQIATMIPRIAAGIYVCGLLDILISESGLKSVALGAEERMEVTMRYRF